VEFRIAETPVFVPQAVTQQMLDTCESIVDLITDPAFKAKTEQAIPPALRVANENTHPHFIAFDFGICLNADGVPEPQLIELQGFPTLFTFQVLLADRYREYFAVPGSFSPYLNGYTKESYLALFKEMLLAGHDPGQVVLLELFPHRQKTRIDFYSTQEATGIQPVCLTELIREGRKLYYINKGVKTEIRRIYNRIIFDELQQQDAAVQEKGRILFEDPDVEWISHPNWFYRISKYTLPFLHHPYIPETFFLSEIKQLPADLNDYVLKPLFSFAGQGVKIDITANDLSTIKDPENWILQRKVSYAPVIQTPDEPAKAEIRIFYFWKDGWARPVAVNNLARLSKGKMIGVDYNKNKTWVGGSACFFEGKS
ncbi:MAG TPA: hypothetical protein VJ647_06000, partial [Chitinophagaceae bacterium]|nr:hypothetical protein [Chitinophagaceae bacterium]